MPEFPRYESQRDIAIESLALRRKGSEEKHLGISKVAKTALDVNVKWANAIDTMPRTMPSAPMLFVGFYYLYSYFFLPLVKSARGARFSILLPLQVYECRSKILDWILNIT